MGPIARWDPMSSMRRFREDMDRMFDDFFGQVTEERVPREMMHVPTVDVIDRENDILVRADMPGIDKDRIHLQATPESLMLRADMQREEEKREGNYLRRERMLGSFQRIIPLPVEVKPNEVTAQYKDGVLEVRLPKSEQARQHQAIPVKVE